MTRLLKHLWYWLGVQFSCTRCCGLGKIPIWDDNGQMACPVCDGTGRR